MTKTSRDMEIMLIHSAIDDYGLDPFEFRIYCHIVRMAGQTGDIKTIAAICKFDSEMAEEALKFLASQGLISIEEIDQDSMLIALCDRENWKPYDGKRR